MLRSESGLWTCLAKNSAGEARKNFNLVVQGIKFLLKIYIYFCVVPITFNETLSSRPIFSVIPGTQFKIECIVDGIPIPKVIVENLYLIILLDKLVKK